MTTLKVLRHAWVILLLAANVSFAQSVRFQQCTGLLTNAAILFRDGFKKSVTIQHSLDSSLLSNPSIGATYWVERASLVFKVPRIQKQPRRADTPKRPNLFHAVVNRLSEKHTEQLEERVSEMSELGFVLESAVLKRGKLQIDFRKQPGLLTHAELTNVPEWHAHQKERLKELKTANQRDSVLIYPRLPSPAKLKQSEGSLLTAKTIGSFQEGLYAFVRRPGENFLRIGESIEELSGLQAVSSAGELFIRKDKETGQNTVRYMRVENEAYNVTHLSLARGVEALWRQGIYSRELKLLGESEVEVIVDFAATTSSVKPKEEHLREIDELAIDIEFTESIPIDVDLSQFKKSRKEAELKEEPLSEIELSVVDMSVVSDQIPGKLPEKISEKVSVVDSNMIVKEPPPAPKVSEELPGTELKALFKYMRRFTDIPEADIRIDVAPNLHRIDGGVVRLVNMHIEIPALEYEPLLPEARIKELKDYAESENLKLSHVLRPIAARAAEQILGFKLPKKPLGAGGFKLVYEHPKQPGKVLKINMEPNPRSAIVMMQRELFLDALFAKVEDAYAERNQIPPFRLARLDRSPEAQALWRHGIFIQELVQGEVLHDVVVANPEYALPEKGRYLYTGGIRSVDQTFNVIKRLEPFVSAVAAMRWKLVIGSPTGDGRTIKISIDSNFKNFLVSKDGTLWLFDY